jgi:prepilin-type processing-associated H-X9-DG protein/prepilin-type N-terminal cleavage/methylation domain-containing protein
MGAAVTFINPESCRQITGKRVGRPAPAPFPRRGFTVLELLTTVAIITTLAALLLPAIGSAREAARRIQCVNHLRQIGLALQSYHEQEGCLPAGWQWGAGQESGYGWAVPLLPFLELRAVYDQVDRNKPIGDSANAAARRATLPVFLCPSDVATPYHTVYAGSENVLALNTVPLLELPTANYVGVFGTLEPDDELPPPPGDGTFLCARPVRFAELERGLANTMTVGERTMARVPSTWLGIDFAAEDAACRLVGNASISPNCEPCDECEFDSRHSGGANFLWGDGHVRFLSEKIDSAEYRRLARRSEF